MQCSCEALCSPEIERYLKAFVLCHTREQVEVHLRTDIEIRHVSKKGHTLLAVFWAKVLQHEANFPQKKFIYTQAYDEDSKADVLIVPADNIQIMVYMGTGSLRLVGTYVYEWFTKQCRILLDNFDPTFSSRWEDSSSSMEKVQSNGIVKKVSPSTTYEKRRERKTMKDYRTATEEYLLLLTNRHIYNGGHEKKIIEDGRYIEREISKMSLGQLLWKGADLCCQATSLQAGCVRDGYDHVYRLWRSLLHNWFSSKDTRVFICSPSLDERCLSDIIDLYLPHYATANIVSMFTQRKCNAKSDNQNSFFAMKRQLLEKYPERTHSVIEYKIYRALVYPTVKFGCKFIAGLRDGRVTVMVTSADFNMDHFVSGNMEFVSVLEMTEKDFIADYVTPLADQAVFLE